MNEKDINTPSIKISREALDWILKKSNENSYISLKIKSSGCNGYGYDLNLASEVPDGSTLIDYEGFTLILRKEDYKFLDNLKIDIEKDLLAGKRLVFLNPNVKNACGCGKSVSFK